MLPDYITKALHKIAKQANFVSYDFDTKSATNHGDNFGGSLLAVTVNGTCTVDGKDVPKALHLVCKLTPTNENRQEVFISKLAFEREIYVYAKLLPILVAFQREKGLSDDESFLVFPKIYASEVDTETGAFILIMENLRAKNFEMWSKDRAIPLEHELLVMNELGKFHGISIAMKDQRPTEFAQFKKLTDIFGVFLQGKMKSFIYKSIKQATDVLVNPKHKQIMENFDHVSSIERLFSSEYSDKFGVISHGDCWNNNFMFRYADVEKTKLESVCLVDWQVARYCSPALDLLYNIFACTDKTFRDQYFTKLLETYYSALSQIVRRLGSDPEQLFTFGDLQEEMRKCGEFALLLGPMVARFTTAKMENLRDVDAYADALANGEDIDFFTKFDDETLVVYGKQVNDIVADLDAFGYLGK